MRMLRHDGASNTHPEMHMAERRDHLEFLDGLRGLASLWVLVGHAMFLTGYRIGIVAQPDLAVELFIIISGFLMAWHYQARESREPWDDPATWKTFWTRRFFRIAPLYYLCLAVALAMGPTLWADRLAAGEITRTPMSETMLYVDRYLDQSLTNILMHVSFLFGMTSTHNFRTPLPDWSIGLEMQFYAVFPFLMLFLKRAGMLVGMAILVGVAAAIGVAVEHMGFVKGAYSILAMKFHLFAAGMLIAASARAEGPMKFMFWLGACAAIFVPLGGGRDMEHRIIKIIMVSGFFGLIYRDSLPKIGALAIRPLDWIFSNPFSRWIGDLSYGAYLIHLLVLLPVCGLLARQWPEMTAMPRFWAALALTIPLTYALAWLAYRYIEQPGIAVGRRLAGKPAKA